MSNFSFPPDAPADDYAEQVTHDALVRATNTAFGRQSADTDGDDATYDGPHSRPNTPEAEPREYPADPATEPAGEADVDSRFAMPTGYPRMSEALDTQVGRAMTERMGSLAAEEIDLAIRGVEAWKMNLDDATAAEMESMAARLPVDQRVAVMLAFANQYRAANVHNPAPAAPPASGHAGVHAEMDRLIAKKMDALDYGRYEEAKRLNKQIAFVASRLNRDDRDAYHGPFSR